MVRLIFGKIMVGISYNVLMSMAERMPIKRAVPVAKIMRWITPEKYKKIDIAKPMLPSLVY